MSEIIEGVSHVDADELYQLLEESKQQSRPSKRYVIDVREPEEYEEAHIPGVPLLPMSEIPDLIDQFDKDGEYVFVCRSGRRSLEVAKFFQSEGIPNVHNYKGGMLAWDKEKAEGPEEVPTPFLKHNGEER